MLRKFIGDRAFYRHIATVAVPIVIQNFITNFVLLLDNIMVGRVGTVEMSGVAIVNQLLFVFNLCVFGAVSGAGIFTAQFFGSSDHKGIRHTFRFKIYAGVLLTALGIALFCLAGAPLITLYLRGDGNPQEIQLTLEHGLSYLKIMLWGLLPFAITNAYSGTLRETQQTVVPMAAGICAVCVNLYLNYVLIFGNFGAPALGVQGAAIATVISRYVELGIVAIWTHANPKKNTFIQGAFRSLHIPKKLFVQILICGTPLLLNECFWALGTAFLNQCYSVRSLDVVAAVNISSTIFNLASVVFLSMGSVVSIIVGQLLGAGTPESQVRDSFRKIATLSVASCVIMGIVLVFISGLFPKIYNTTDSVQSIATQLICVSAFFMPFNAYVHSVYFALRSGGQTMITLLFDSCFMWVICVPLAFCLSRFTNIPIIPLYAICLSTDFIKCFIGTVMIRGNRWIQNLTNE